MQIKEGANEDIKSAQNVKKGIQNAIKPGFLERIVVSKGFQVLCAFFSQ